MGSLVAQLLEKLNLRNEERIHDKTNELLRRLDQRSTSLPAVISEYGKIVICADIASEILNLPLDKDVSLKVSGMTKRNYVKNKHLLEKLLAVNQTLGINEMCIRLGTNEFSKKARELFESFKKVMAERGTEIDSSHPQYAAMSVYKACKADKKRISKTSLLALSNLGLTQWQYLERTWDKILSSSKTDELNGIQISHDHDNNETNKNTGIETNTQRQCAHSDEYETYATWKRRILKEAQAKLCST